MTQLLAYHGSQEIKDKYLSRIRAHRAADNLIQGTGWVNGRGCAVGCTLESYSHYRYPAELGVPIELAYPEDRLFDLSDLGSAMLWPERFLSAIRPGSDLSHVWQQWAIWMLTDPDHGVIRHSSGYAGIESAILRVAELWRIGGSSEQFAAAGSAARAAEAAAEAAGSAGWAAWVKAACDKLITLLEAA